MIRVEDFDVRGFRTAVRAMRNPHDSWDRSDSGYIASGEHYENVDYVIGPKDLELMQKLVKAGAEHRTFMRMITVSMDITAPFLWWKEMDRYCVGKAQVSCSTMHSIHKKPFTMDDFSTDGMTECGKVYLEKIIDWLEDNRLLYNDTGCKTEWRDMICLLPSCYNQKRTVTMNYEVAMNIIRQRSGHKLSEWTEFVEVLKGLPYMTDLMEDKNAD